MKEYLKKNVIAISSILLIVLILISVGVSFYNGKVIGEYNAIKSENAAIKKELEVLMNSLQALDIGVRGYALTKKDQLLAPYTNSLKDHSANCDKIEQFIYQHNYQDAGDWNRVKIVFKEYHAVLQQMIDLVKEDNMTDFVLMLNQDRGYTVWKTLASFQDKTLAEQDKILQNAEQRYERVAQQNRVVQSILLLIGIPVLASMLIRIRKDMRNRRALLQELVNNNRTYIFDPGTHLTFSAPEEIVETSIVNFKEAHNFISRISSGDYEVDWAGLNSKNLPLNEDSLAGKLVKLKEQMKLAKQEDEKRRWATEGVTQFTEIVRKHQQDLDSLTHQVVSFLVKYMNAQQGSLFVLQEEGGEKILDLVACYAFDRKKYIQKQIAVGQGLVGQTYREAQTTLLTQIPQGYTTITSGLGDSTPGCLVVVPMKHNNKVEAVLELAGFQKYEPYQVTFLEKLGEIVASTVTTVRTNGKMQHFLQDSQMQAEQMRAQEEEMRQNMEELAATQEEMQRRMSESDKLKEELVIRESVFNITTILSESDKFGTILYANDKLCQVSKYSRQELIGKPHNLFRHPDMPSQLFKLMWATIKSGQAFRGIIKNRAKDGSHYWVDAVIYPVLGPDGKPEKYIGARYLLTDEALAQSLYDRMLLDMTHNKQLAFNE